MRASKQLTGKTLTSNVVEHVRAVESDEELKEFLGARLLFQVAL